MSITEVVRLSPNMGLFRCEDGEYQLIRGPMDSESCDGWENMMDIGNGPRMAIDILGKFIDEEIKAHEADAYIKAENAKAAA